MLKKTPIIGIVSSRQAKKNVEKGTVKLKRTITWQSREILAISQGFLLIYFSEKKSIPLYKSYILKPKIIKNN